MTQSNGDILLLIENLSVYYGSDREPVTALRQVSLRVDSGETVGIVGESGCGKSSLALAITRLLPDNARMEADRLEFRGQSLLDLPETAFHQLRGESLAIVFQEPRSALDPLARVGSQIVEGIRHRRGLSRSQAESLALHLLAEAEIPDPKRVSAAFPHQLSGGMLQRSLLAAALAEDPALLLADEPTTALDVSTQARVLRLLAQLRTRQSMSILLISHDLSVIASLADRVLVLYLGSIVEEGPSEAVLEHPQHPYTQALLRSLPRPGQLGPLPALAGHLPPARGLPPGCPFHPRCPEAIKECREDAIPRVELPGRQFVRCLRRPEEPQT